jgi:hypothetical protein
MLPSSIPNLANHLPRNLIRSCSLSSRLDGGIPSPFRSRKDYGG